MINYPFLQSSCSPATNVISHLSIIYSYCLGTDHRDVTIHVTIHVGNQVHTSAKVPWPICWRWRSTWKSSLPLTPRGNFLTHRPKAYVPFFWHGYRQSVLYLTLHVFTGIPPKEVRFSAIRQVLPAPLLPEITYDFGSWDVHLRHSPKKLCTFGRRIICVGHTISNADRSSPVWTPDSMACAILPWPKLSGLSGNCYSKSWQLTWHGNSALETQAVVLRDECMILCFFYTTTILLIADCSTWVDPWHITVSSVSS